MRPSKLTEDDKRFIGGCDPLKFSTAELAERFGVTEQYIRKFRREAKQERHEIAREVISRHVEENVPDALADLADLRKMARENYEATKNPKDGNLWLGAIKTTLEHVTPDDATIDEAIDAELANVAFAGKATSTPTYPGAAAYH